MILSEWEQIRPLPRLQSYESECLDEGFPRSGENLDDVQILLARGVRDGA